MTTKQTQIAVQKSTSLHRHARKCTICHHEDREDIELDFLHWHHCTSITSDYNLKDFRTIYRHAHATGLWERRMLNLRSAVAHLVENAENVEPSATAVLKAIQACSQINDRGEWIDAPRRIIYQIEHHHTHVGQPPEQTAAPESGDDPSESDISNRQWKGLENAATLTKH